ncbi:hypothetical protein Defa_23660 [Desulfovibrio sp. TH_2024_36128]|uniref:Uncharacterized protein n=1 Tax=Desulfovibrio falkowii TaxID=3136602 RepID=A0ABQ0EB57_9BACT
MTDERLMPEVHTVKIADGKAAVFRKIQFFNGVCDIHVLPVPKQKYTCEFLLAQARAVAAGQAQSRKARACRRGPVGTGEGRGMRGTNAGAPRNSVR